MNFHPLSKHIYLSRAGHLTTVKMLKLELAHGAFKGSPMVLLLQPWSCPHQIAGREMNSRLRLGLELKDQFWFWPLWLSLAGLQFAFHEPMLLFWLFQRALAWWSPKSSPPSVKQSQTWVGGLAGGHFHRRHVYLYKKSILNGQALLAASNKQRPPLIEQTLSKNEVIHTFIC